MSTTVLLDTNVYDLLAADAVTRGSVAVAVSSGQILVIATPKVVDELSDSPFEGLPKWFPIETVVESVAVLGHWRLGLAALGEGEVYTAHRGRSRKVADAIIADSADCHADVLVSEDGRVRRRLAGVSTRCRPMDYAEFCVWLESVS